MKIKFYRNLINKIEEFFARTDIITNYYHFLHLLIPKKSLPIKHPNYYKQRYNPMLAKKSEILIKTWGKL